MGKTDKHWSDAKIPAWVRESIKADIKDNELKAALSWPTDVKPKPVFHIGDYGRGNPVSGTFYRAPNVRTQIYGNISPEKFVVSVNGYTAEFKSDNGHEYKHSNPRGEFFETAYEAMLWAQWVACERYADDLLKIQRALDAQEAP